MKKSALRVPSARSAPSRASDDWSSSSSYSSSYDSDYTTSSSRDGESDEERGRCASGGCCGPSARPAPPPAVSRFDSSRSSLPPASQRLTKGEAALAKKLQAIDAVDDDEVPTTLWTRPSRSLAIERSEALQPRFKARCERRKQRTLKALMHRVVRHAPPH